MKNIAELLKDCPKGTKLYSPLCGECTFDRVNHGTIICQKRNFQEITFTSEGYYMIPVFNDAECLLFPSKENRNWDNFVTHSQFKNGDIIVHTQNDRFVMSVYHKRIADALIKTHCVLWDRDEGLSVNVEICCYNDSVRFATEEEKQKLFQAIKDNGYKWNAETKTLEKLVVPKFKVGDKVREKEDEGAAFTISDINDSCYYCGEYVICNICDQEFFELVPDKFDITTLKPFESRVLVREGKTDVWQPAFYGFFNQHNKRFYTTSTTWLMCIPYNEDTKHLIGTTNDCDEYYKTWK